MADGEEVMPTLADQAILAPFDRAASFAALFDAHYPAVLAYCRRRAPSDEAGDAALATFEVLWRSMDDPPVRPLPWLYKVAAGQLANSRRSERRRRRLLDRLSGRARGGPSPTDPAEATTEASAARAALARLKAADREVLLLVAWEGLSPDEAAVALGISPATFAVRLHRARRRLEALLADHPTPHPPKDVP